METRVAVVMSVYSGDTHSHFEQAVKSILSQRNCSYDLYIYQDGEVSPEIKNLLSSFFKQKNIKVLYGAENIGLAAGLNKLIQDAIKEYPYSHIVRMDSDDISKPNRISSQLSYMSLNRLDVCGTAWDEIDEHGVFLGTKSLPLTDDELKKNIVKRSPFNHPTVVFNSKIFFDGFFYNPSLKSTQDYYLWIDLARHGYKFGNLSEPLLYYRRSNDFYRRRSWAKAKLEFMGRIYAMQQLKKFTVSNIAFLFFLVMLRLSPTFLKRAAYKYLR